MQISAVNCLNCSCNVSCGVYLLIHVGPALAAGVSSWNQFRSKSLEAACGSLHKLGRGGKAHDSEFRSTFCISALRPQLNVLRNVLFDVEPHTLCKL